MIRIVLPWPNGTLHPNSRAHHMVKARHTRQARCDARMLCLAAGVRKLDAEAVTVRLTLHPPDRRRRDLPDAISALKASIDGIADALGIDDSRFRWLMPETFAEPFKGGQVVVEITPVIEGWHSIGEVVARVVADVERRTVKAKRLDAQCVSCENEAAEEGVGSARPGLTDERLKGPSE